MNMIYLWYCHLDHISESRIDKKYKEKFFDPYDYKSLGACEFYLIGKMTKTPFSGHRERAKKLLALVHSDVCGPMTAQAKRAYSYFITFIDDLSKFGYVSYEI